MTNDRLDSGIEILDAVTDRFHDLVASEVDFGTEATFTLYIEIPTASQATRVASTVERVDHAVRRATAAFEKHYDADGRLRLTSLLTSGLVIESVAIGSYHGKHRLQGKSEQWASRHPFQFALLFMFLAGAQDAYIVPNYPFAGDDPRPPVVEPQHPTQHISIDLGDTIRLRDLEPPTAGGGGTAAEVTIVIEGPQGRTAITFTSVPRSPRIRH